MDLSSIRGQFVSRSGRADLVNSDGSDNGADVFINEGQHLLDDLVNQGVNSSLWYYDLISAGDSYLYIPQVRSIEKIYIVATDSSGDEGRDELVKVDHREFLQKFGLSSSNSGTPRYWSPVKAEQVGTNLFKTHASYEAEGYKDYTRLMWGLRNFGYTAILLSPLSDGEYTIEVYGQFDSPELKIITLSTDGARANDTVYTVGGIYTFSDSSVWQVTAVTGSSTSGSSEPTITGTSEGDTVDDGELTWAKLADSTAVQMKSFWSVRRPGLLITAALACHERSLKNSTGFNDYVSTIMPQLEAIGTETVEDDLWQMNDSWEDE
jgi:hypothetical protein